MTDHDLIVRTAAEPAPGRTGGNTTGHSTGHIVGAVVGLTTLLSVLLLAFAWPSSQLEPRHLPVAVAAPPEVAAQVEAGLAGAVGEEAVDVTAVATRADAVSAIEDREVYGAIVATPQGPEVLTASAGSPAVAQLLGQVGSALAAGSGAPPTVTDVAPLPEDDPRGAVFGAGSFPLVIGGIAVGAVVSLRLAGRASRVAATAGVTLLAGPVLVAILQYWFGALDGSYLANAGVVSLGLGAIAFTLVGLHHLFGPAGLGLGAATVLLLGNPLSGIASAPELLPDGWSLLGQLLPPGATGTALRSTAFFDGAGASTPLLVLAGWLAAGLLLAVLPSPRRAAQPASRRTTSSPAPRTEAGPAV